jgi:hypothetical protein
MPIAYGIPVHASNARAGEHLDQALFALLRAGSQKVEMLALTLGAVSGYAAPKAAVMAFQPLADLRMIVL